MTADRQRFAADALVITGGAAMLVSAFAHWVSRGTGSGLRGHALVDAIIAVGRDFPGMSGARLTVLWYLVPATGAASWIATGLWGAGSRAARAIAVVAVVVALVSIGAIGWIAGYTHLGFGAWLALGGAVALVVASWVVAPASRLPTSAGPWTRHKTS